MADKKIAVIAIGGNSLIKDSKHQSVEDQYEAANESCKHIADMIEAGYEVVIGHGNGPQVGFILRRSEIAAKVEGMHEIPLDVCGADSQGAIGYALQQNLQNELYQRGIKKKVVTVITQVLVDRDDPAFRNPSKPIGGFMDAAEAKRRKEEQDWTVVEDAGRGWRRVVASPLPKEIVELETVETLLERGIKIDAIFTGDDDSSIGVLAYLKEAGIRVPEDIAIAGFDDIPLARHLTPPLTTVRAPIEMAAREAVNQLVRLIRTGEAERLVLLPTELVIRRSCGNPAWEA